MKKFVIVYRDVVKPFTAKSIEDIKKRIQKDWNNSSENDSESFESCGLKILFHDYAQGKVNVIPLEVWYHLNE